MARAITVVQAGRSAYVSMLERQRELQARRREAGPDLLILTEHAPVFTLGKSHPVPDLRVPAGDARLATIPIVPTERGGDITYHGPGQLVAYGIIDLRGWSLGVTDYVDGLEETVVRTLASFGIAGERRPGARGAWVGDRKIASLGVNVRRWVTMHGIALNVDLDLEPFTLINPCGLVGVQMTSIARECGRAISVDEAAAAFVRHFAQVFDAQLEFAPADAGTLFAGPVSGA